MTTQTLTPSLERPSLPRRWLAGWGSVLLLITSALTSIGAMVLVSLVLTAVLLISADLEELIGLSDTIRVILRGRITGEFDPDVVTSQQLGSAMTGAGKDAS
mgnify:CR=1 FL=1